MTVFNFKLDKSLVRLASVEIAEATMRDILLIGAGKIGETIADMLCASGDYRVTVADRSDLQLQKLPRRPPIRAGLPRAIFTRSTHSSSHKSATPIPSGAYKWTFLVRKNLPYQAIADNPNSEPRCQTNSGFRSAQQATSAKAR